MKASAHSHMLTPVFRTILSHILFNCSPEEANRRLDSACEKQGFRLNQILINPSQTSFKDPNETVMSYEYEIELGSEMELSINVDDNTAEDSTSHFIVFIESKN